MQTPSMVLQQVARDFVDVIPEVDIEAQHERWKPGIGPFGEVNQIKMILEKLIGGDDLGCLLLSD